MKFLNYVFLFFLILANKNLFNEILRFNINFFLHNTLFHKYINFSIKIFKYFSFYPITLNKKLFYRIIFTFLDYYFHYTNSLPS